MDRGYTYDADGRVAAHKTPLIGPYSSADRETVRLLQLELMRLSSADGTINNWYGTQGVDDYKVNRVASDVLVDECSRLGMLFTICYEDWTVRSTMKWGERPPDGPEPEAALALLKKDFAYVRDRYMSRPGFLKTEDRGAQGWPVILVFGPRRFTEGDNWRAMLEAAFPGPAIDHRPLMLKLDGRSGGFDGSFSWSPPLADSTVETVHENLRQHYERTRGQLRVGSVFPGFHDFYVEGSNGTMPSYGRLLKYDGRTVEASIAKAREYRPAFIQLCTWKDRRAPPDALPFKRGPTQNKSHPPQPF